MVSFSYASFDILCLDSQIIACDSIHLIFKNSSALFFTEFPHTIPIPTGPFPASNILHESVIIYEPPAARNQGDADTDPGFWGALLSSRMETPLSGGAGQGVCPPCLM